MEKKPVSLRCGEYLEATLVDKICTEAQKKAYHKKEKFPDSRQKSRFLHKLDCYCDYVWDPENGKYAVTEVYDVPMLLPEAKIHRGIYQYLAPLMLLNVLYGEHSADRKAVITSLDLARGVSMVNDNYRLIRSNQGYMAETFEFSRGELAEYFNKADNRIDEYIRRCVKYLATLNCVIYNETHLIGFAPKEVVTEDGSVITKPGEVRRATDEEMKLYAKIDERASRKARIGVHAEKWYGKKASVYTKELNRLLKANGIEYVCRSFDLWKVDEERCKQILDGFNDMSPNQRRMEIGLVMKMIMDENAEKRLEKDPTLGIDYVEHFKTLSDITLRYNYPYIGAELRQGAIDRYNRIKEENALKEEL